MKHEYKSNPYMDEGVKMILSTCRCKPSIMAHPGTEKYHKANMSNTFMDGGGEMILSVCKYCQVSWP